MWLQLWKRYFVKCEIQSIFDYTLKGHHQRKKIIEEINDYHKRGLGKVPRLCAPNDQFMSSLIS